jgi:hypothetical protein
VGHRGQNRRMANTDGAVHYGTDARESSETTPFVMLVSALAENHERERPMRIPWRLEYPVPGDFYLTARAGA